MFGDALFFEYIVAIFLGLSGLGLIMMCLVHGNNCKETTYKKMRNYLFFSFLLGLSFFIFYYREVILQIYHLNMAGRVADYFVSVGFIFTWIALVFTMLQREELKKIYGIARIYFFLDLFIQCMMAAFVLDSDYYVENQAARVMALMVYLILATFEIVLILVFLIKSFHAFVERKNILFIGATSTLLVLWKCSTLVFNIQYLYGVYPESSWGGQVFDITGILLIGINLVAILFIYKTDFSLIVTNSNGPTVVAIETDISQSLNGVADMYHLTEREKEILGLAYHGYTNPDIAKKLNISFNTSKSHMHHIFEKLDVNSRVELVHMINSQM